MDINLLLKDSIIGYFNKVSPWDCFNKILEYLLTSTESEYGLVGLVRKDPDTSEMVLVPYGISNVSWTSTMSNTVKFLTFRADRKNLLNYPILNKETLVTNDPKNHEYYKGAPQGHYEIKCLLGVPIIYNDEVIGVISISNRDKGYTKEIIDQVEAISLTLRPIFQLYNGSKENMEYYGSKTMSDKVLNTLNDAILIIDKFNKINYFNTSFLDLFKIDKNIHIENKKLANVIPYMYDYYINIASELKKEAKYSEQLLFEISNINVPIYVTASYIYEQGAEYILIFFTSMTKYDSLLRSQLDKKDKYIHFINHEIRNSLQSIMMSCFVLEGLNKQGLEKNKQKIEKNIKIIDKSSKMIKRILDDIKNIEDINNGNIEVIKNEFNIVNLLAKIINGLDTIIKNKKINIKYSISDILCFTDEIWLEKALTAIIVNSIRHCDEGIINITYNKSNTYQFLIIDNGVGYSKEDLDNLENDNFEIQGISDTTVDPSYGTFQTNLFLAKKLINKLNGKIEIFSEKHHGTKYCIELPVEQKLSNGINLNIKNILIVDDNEDNADTMESYIVDLNETLDLGLIHINKAYSGYECIGISTETKYDLIFLDINMVGIDGYKTAKLLKENGYKGDIIALTGNIYITSKNKNTLNNIKLFNGHLVKPTTKNDIKNVLLKYKQNI